MTVGEVKPTAPHPDHEDLAPEVAKDLVVLLLVVGLPAKLRIHGHQVEAAVPRGCEVDPQPHLADDLLLHSVAAIVRGLVLLRHREMNDQDHLEAHTGGGRGPPRGSALRRLVDTKIVPHPGFTAIVHIAMFPGPQGETSIK